MIDLLGIGCVVWTVLELARLMRETPSRPRPDATHRGARADRSPRPRRAPLAAWDEAGRPIVVEDVAFRNAR
ncbi:MAG: hypothetical protein R3F35_02575 [Myxococcota bacterium]